MKETLHNYCNLRIAEFGQISQTRKEVLTRISKYVMDCHSIDRNAQLVFICTHNSRRSHFGMIWAKVASVYYGILEVETYSGGTEATAFHPNAIAAIMRAGIEVNKIDDSSNPKYQVVYDDLNNPLICFSKVYDHETNPQANFAAIMTCGDAEENCPFIQGVDLRVATTYDDPKAFDNTGEQDLMYSERCAQIAREMLYVFSLVSDEV
jgi:protein-tyrosine-phosphatase